MMPYFFIEPEVAGGLGARTSLDQSSHPPVVTRLYHEFDGWLGDVLLESFPCLIVTEHAAERLRESGMTGIAFGDVEITKSQLFIDLHPGKQLPRFSWLQVHGISGVDDFGLAADGRLVVSEQALEMLRELGAANALISEYQR